MIAISLFGINYTFASVELAQTKLRALRIIQAQKARQLQRVTKAVETLEARIARERLRQEAITVLGGRPYQTMKEQIRDNKAKEVPKWISDALAQKDGADPKSNP